MLSKKTKFLAAGLLAGTLTLVGCRSDTSAERAEEPTDTTQPAEGTPPATETPPGTGGAGPTQTRPSDDNLRRPYEDPLRTPEDESIRDAESELPVHDDGTEDPGIGGAGTGGADTETDVTEEDDLNELNEGGNINESYRIPDSPADVVTEDELEIPEGTR